MQSAIIVRVVIIGVMLTLTALLFATTAPQSAAGRTQHYRMDEAMLTPPAEASAGMDDQSDATDGVGNVENAHTSVAAFRNAEDALESEIDDSFLLQLSDGTEVARPRSPFELGDERILELQSMTPLAVMAKPSPIKAPGPAKIQRRPGRSAGASPLRPIRTTGMRGIGQFKSQQMYVPFAGRGLFKSRTGSTRTNQVGQRNSKDDQFYRPWWR